jgi:hypothetical protein
VIRYEVETVVPAPPDETFAELLDVGSWRQWMPGVLESAYRTAGPPRPGHRGYAVRQLYGLRVELELRLVELERPRWLALAFGSRHGLTGRAAVAVEPAVDSALVRLEVEASSPGASLLDGVAGRVWQRADARALRQLRKRLGG